MIKSIGHILNLDFKKQSRKNKGFTIVELLVVIVVIGILAAITIVSYSGITNKAIVASVKNDLDNNSKLLKMYNVDHGYYPSSLDSDYCPATPDVDKKYCLKVMKDAVLSYFGSGQTFTLIDTHTPTTTSYKLTESGDMSVYVVPQYQQWAGYPQTPELTSDYPVQYISTNGSMTVLYLFNKAVDGAPDLYMSDSNTRMWGTSRFKNYWLNAGVWQSWNSQPSMGNRFYNNDYLTILKSNTNIYTDSSGTVIFYNKNS